MSSYERTVDGQGMELGRFPGTFTHIYETSTFQTLASDFGRAFQISLHAINPMPIFMIIPKHSFLPTDSLFRFMLSCLPHRRLPAFLPLDISHRNAPPTLSVHPPAQNLGRSTYPKVHPSLPSTCPHQSCHAPNRDWRLFQQSSSMAHLVHRTGDQK